MKSGPSHRREPSPVPPLVSRASRSDEERWRWIPDSFIAIALSSGEQVFVMDSDAATADIDALKSIALHDSAPTPTGTGESGDGTADPTIGFSGVAEHTEQTFEHPIFDQDRAEVEKVHSEISEESPPRHDEATETAAGAELLKKEELQQDGVPQDDNSTHSAVTDTHVQDSEAGKVQNDSTGDLSIEYNADKPSHNHPDDSSSGVLEDLPVKEYLDATVVPALRDGLRMLAKQRPEDPHTFLGDYIKAHRAAAE